MGMEVTRSISGSNYGATEAHVASVAQETAPRAIEQANPVQNFNSDTNQNEQGEAKGNKPSESTIKQAISDINKKINPNTVAQYGFHDDTNRVTIKIVDKDTDDLIKEYPAEETLDMIAKVWELAGMFVDEKG